MKSLIALATILVAFFIAPAAHAATGNTIGLHLGSVHSNNYDAVSGRNWNNANPGIYFRHDDYVVGTYYNSVRQQSYYAGYVYEVTPWFDVIVGAINGYAREGSKAWQVIPLVVPSAHFNITGPWDARLIFIPQIEKGGASALHLAIERKF